ERTPGADGLPGRLVDDLLAEEAARDAPAAHGVADPDVEEARRETEDQQRDEQRRRGLAAPRGEGDARDDAEDEEPERESAVDREGREPERRRGEGGARRRAVLGRGALGRGGGAGREARDA